VNDANVGHIENPSVDTGSQGLSSDQIDSLAWKALAKRSAEEPASAGRLPMLEIILDRFVRSLATTMRNFTNENVDLSLDNIYATRFGQLISTIPSPGMIGMVRSTSWHNSALLACDAPLIYSVVDVLLGGRRGGNTADLDGRTFTTIERRLIERMFKAILGDLNASFAPAGAPGFVHTGLETNARFARINRPDVITTVAVLRFYINDRGGKILLALPHNLLQPALDFLGQQFVGDDAQSDGTWVEVLADQAHATNLGVEIVLDTVDVDLADVINWKAGSVLELNASRGTLVDVRVGGRDLFKGELGRTEQNLAVRIV